MTRTSRDMEDGGRVRFEWSDVRPDAARYIRLQQAEETDGAEAGFRGLEIAAIDVYSTV